MEIKKLEIYIKKKNYDYLKDELGFGFIFNCFVNQDEDFRVLMVDI